MVTMESRMGSLPQPYTSLPASPTLTNPDMILPDYPDYDRSASPNLDGDRHSQLMWKNSHNSSNSDLQQLFSGVHAFTNAPTTPTTPIIYGNGTMLSDIGEVTEVESTPGKPSPNSIRRRGGGAMVASPSSSRSASPSPLPQHIRRQFDREGSTETPRASSPTAGFDDAGDSSTGTVHNVGGGVGGVKQRARLQQQKLQQQQQSTQDCIRRDSIDSNSTITTQDQAGLFADFDDAISVDDSVFQGDDEESVAEFYTDESFSPREVHGVASITPSSLLAVPSQSSGPGSTRTSDEDDRRHSTASLSRRAEEILANAKRRLTTMEDNLTRARSTLHATAPSLGSVPSDGSTPSPRTPERSATAFADNRPYDATYISRHARLGSEGYTPFDNSNAQNALIQKRSASALGAAGGYRPPRSGAAQSIAQLRDSLDNDYAREGYVKAKETPLEPLGEYEDIEDAGNQPQQSRNSAQLESFLSPTFGTFNGSGSKGLTRSSSVTQMRDLKHQMKDLRGKISSLREQARVDSMKRRSLQSLRNPSPFTYARIDQWYADAQPNQESVSEENGSSEHPTRDGYVSNGNEDGGMYRDTVTPTAQIYGDTAVAETTTSHSGSARSNKDTGDEIVAGAYSDADDHTTKLSRPHTPKHHATNLPQMEDTTGDSLESDAFVDAHDADDMRTEDGWDEDDVATPTAKTDENSRLRGRRTPDDDEVSVAESQDVGYESEGGESLYHDTVQHQISHEDREDAFDYEHFILHSALGTISQQRLNRSSRGNSFSSEDSVETTRGPVVATTDNFYSNLNRRGSMSSFESFATATEGRSSRAKQELYDDETEESSDAESQYYEGEGGREGKWAVLTAKPSISDFPVVPSSTAAAAAFRVPVIAERKSAEEPRQMQRPVVPSQPATGQRPSSSAAKAGHRPSVSSFESTGTTRSFPLVGQGRLIGSSGSSGSNGSNGSNSRSASAAGDVRGATPSSRTSSDNEELKSLSRTILNETASIYEQATLVMPRHRRPRSLDSQTSESNTELRDRASNNNSRSGAVSQMDQSEALNALDKEDQYMVQRLVGSLGQCVLGLTEHGRASVESRICRRRIEAARRILEGLDPV
ncbi:hypothetical protein CMQ_1060 [Grosmannia clavigera kw1407]|uniref:Uncharacterized protein n=1 Tax=Grosmannia clavigera (strain kw1407 / UAMH 11150) TaxID=655863 RepID=F0XDT8_GROCL|nr:uncharacterized protein CMQ_1060 [Grosmannia clavigera kw1407]EFX04132.1 hypothetical protein CMQ_1060 [Grosmannia clavigera kw1407]